MKTVKSTLTIIAVLVSGVLFAQTLKVDASKSTLKWTGEKLGGKHYGKIALTKGSFDVKGDKIVAGEFIIDMNSITCDDIEGAEYNAKLVGHLKSDDFFGTSKYPEAKLVITSSSKFKNGKAKVKADLTIKGKTNPVEFVVLRMKKGYSADVVVDRSKYDVRYGSKSFFDDLGDKVIADEFTLSVALVVD